MSGQPNPPIIVEAFAKNAPDCDPSAPIAGGKTFPLPVTSQQGIVNGAASLDDGFVPLNMTSPTLGGVPPFGVDMNGILYLLSAQAAALGAGQVPIWDEDLKDAMTGYKLGAILTKADGSGFWFNGVDGNTSDPDASGAGWIGFTPSGTGYLLAVPSAGNNNNYNPTGYGISIGVLDLNPTGGNATITGIMAGFDGQRLIVSNVHASNTITLASMSGSSSDANRLRLPVDLTLLENTSFTLQYSVGAGLWILA